MASELPLPQPVFGRPYLIIEGRVRTLAAADLHIGMERELAMRGLKAPSRAMEMADSISAAGRAADASRLILAGDVKHAIPGPSVQEDRDVPSALERMLETFSEVHIVPGNHDVGIRSLAPAGVRLHGAGGYRAGSAAVVHGHRWPNESVMRARLVVFAHNHPNVSFTDAAGAVASAPCWLRGQLAGDVIERYPRFGGGFILMPASTPYGSGTAVNRRPPSFLGPLLGPGRFDSGSCRVYTLDGADLGALDGLSPPAERVEKTRNIGRGRSQM